MCRIDLGPGLEEDISALLDVLLAVEISATARTTARTYG
jgi:hypothetical protein